MLAFWANSNTFGTSGTAGQANNGIDFSNVRIEFIPEPSTAVLGILSAALVGAQGVVRRRRRRFR
jgi:hypothetical protein